MWRDLAELVRAPAAVTVPGDTLAGAVAAGWPAGRRTLLLPVASTCLYWAGMALNDYADRERDQVERPERPIPSGRVAPRTALSVATGLTAAGVAVAAVAGGRRTALTAGALAAAVWAYDLSAKEGPLSVATMASTRGLDVLMGASAGGPDALGRALVPAGIIATHTASVTALSRGETHGTTRATAVGCAAATAGVVALAAQRARAAGPVAQLVAAASAGLYAAPLLRSQLLAARTPGGPQAAAATGTGIRSLVPLQATLVAGQGAPVAAGLLVAGARGLAATMRRVST